MKSHYRGLWVGVLVGGAALLLNHAAMAQLVGFSTFTLNEASGATTPNYTGIGLTSTTYGVTGAVDSQASSAFSSIAQNISSGFTASFDYTSTPGPAAGNGGYTNLAADGFTFCLQNLGTTALGGTGSSYGYSGITPSVAIETDNFGGTTNYAGSTGLVTNGTSPGGNETNTFTSPGLYTGDTFLYTLVYNPNLLTLVQTVTDTTSALGTSNTFTYTLASTLASSLGSNTALIGFTGATGGFNATQTITNFTYTVPEPGTWAAVALGCAAVILVTARRRASR